MFYAQIDGNGICFAVSNLMDIEDSPNMILLDAVDETLLGKQYVNGVWSNPPITPATLSQAQSAKVTQLKTMYAQTLATGFVSSASGSAVTYGFAPNDQDNMTQIQSAISAGIETWPVEYGDVHGNVILLNQAQFTVLETDANRFKWAQVKQLRTLIGNVMTATTPDTVNAVQWTPAPY